MFGQITEKFQAIFRNVRGLGKITDTNIHETAREVRKALLDADVNFGVVKSFVSDVEKKAQGTKVLKSIKPGEQFVKIIRDELVGLLGSEKKYLNINRNPSVVMLVGLQGAGKTTTAGKLANNLKESGRSVLLTAADIYRPAAIKQLQIIGKQIGIDVFQTKAKTPLDICQESINKANLLNNDIVILDTAGRIQSDEKMMREVKDIANVIMPDEILFVVDGMTGQDAVKSAKAFHNLLSLTGVILTKMDGDARGGAAVSISHVTGVPIKFMGTGESINAFEVFDPQRIADRILGLGDVISLVEKAEKVFDVENANIIHAKIRSNDFNLVDFKNQLKQIKNIGPIGDLLTMLPTSNPKALGMMNGDERQINWTEAIINSMTLDERKKPNIIDGSRRLRIAKGSGRTVQEVNSLLNQFQLMKKMIKKVKNYRQNKFSGFSKF